MRLEYLIDILEVIRAGSISSAAKKLWVGPTSLSAVIKSVESELNTEIFLRTPKGVMLTDDGRALLPQIERVVENYQLLCNMASSPSHYKTMCNLACYPALAPLLGPYVAQNVGKYSEYVLNVKNTLSYQILQTVSEGSADIGVATVPLDMVEDMACISSKNNMSLEKMCTDHFVLCVNGDSPFAQRDLVDLDELKGEELCSAAFFPQFTGSYPAVDFGKFAQHSVFDEMESVKRIVSTTNAVSIMPRLVFKDDIYVESGRLKLVELVPRGSDFELVNVMIYSNRPQPHVVSCALNSIRDFYNACPSAN